MAAAQEGEGGEAAAATSDEPDRVCDALPLLEEASGLKDQANAQVKQKEPQEAVKLYEQGLEVLSRSDGHPMLRDEKSQADALKAVLYSNIAQCMLTQQLYRRAVDSASECLKLDADNTKALHRRSQAYEALKEYEEALRDAIALQKLGGGGLDMKALQRRCEQLYERQIAENMAVNEVAKSNEDLFKMKERFDVVLEKYDLGDGEAAPLVANWLVTDKDLPRTVDRVAKQWVMSKKEAEDFTKWIKKGIEMKVIPTPKASSPAAS